MVRGLTLDLHIANRRLAKEVVNPVMGQITSLIPANAFPGEIGLRQKFISRTRALVMRAVQLVSAGNALRTAQGLVSEYNKKQGYGFSTRAVVRDDQGRGEELEKLASELRIAIAKKNTVRVVYDLSMIIHRCLSLANSYGLELDDYFIEICSAELRRGGVGDFEDPSEAFGKYETRRTKVLNQADLERLGILHKPTVTKSTIAEIETILAQQVSRFSRMALSSSLGRQGEPGAHLFEDINAHLTDATYFKKLDKYLRQLDIRSLSVEDLPSGFVENEHYVIKDGEVQLVKLPPRGDSRVKDFDDLL